MDSTHRAGLALILFSIAFFAASCSVISKEVRKSTRPDIGFEALMQNPDRHTGKTVLLGGYILETRNQPEKTEIVLLHAPLSIGDEPRSKDASRGRFIVFHKGFLDPEIFSKNRKVTVAGTLFGTRVDPIDEQPYTYLLFESREIYLWPKFKRQRYYPYPYPDPFYPYPHYRDPFYRSPYFR